MAHIISNAKVINVTNALAGSKGRFATIVLFSSADDDMNKGRGTNANQLYGKVTKKVTYKAWQIGTNYNNACQNSVERSGSDKAFEPSKSWHIYANDFFEVDKKTESKYYLQVQHSAEQGSAINKEYFVNGHPMTEAEKEYLKPYFKAKKQTMPNTQIDAGITEEHKRIYNTLTFENVYSIECGNIQLIDPSGAFAKAESTSKAESASK